MKFLVPSIMRRTSSGLRTVGSFRGVLKRKLVEVHVAAFEHLLEEEAQGRHSHLDRPRIEFPLLQQIPLEALNMCCSQSIGRFTEILRELFDGQNVAANCGR